jgi:CBS domain-containing protein
MPDNVKDVMTSDCTCVGESDSIQDVAKKLEELNVGAMPICGDDDKLHGMITDRDIALKVVAAGKDPSEVTAADLAQGKPVTIESDASCSDAMKAMAENQVRRLPVIGDDKRLVGIVSQADLARQEDNSKVGGMVESISE